MKVSLNQDSWLRSLPSIKSDAKPWNQKINLQKDKKKEEMLRMNPIDAYDGVDEAENTDKSESYQ